MWTAIRFAHLEAIQWFVEQGNPISMMSRVLMVAVEGEKYHYYGREEEAVLNMVQWLLEQGADPREGNNAAIKTAVKHRRSWDVFEVLLAHKASAKTALTFARDHLDFSYSSKDLAQWEVLKARLEAQVEKKILTAEVKKQSHDLKTQKSHRF